MADRVAFLISQLYYTQRSLGGHALIIALLEYILLTSIRSCLLGAGHIVELFQYTLYAFLQLVCR
jgi:hypothetical protein